MRTSRFFSCSRSLRMGRFFRPRSPVNPSRICCPVSWSLISHSSRDDPRMCPASRNFTVMPGAMWIFW